MSERWQDLLVVELLVGVAKHGSVSASAQSLGIAQPNASRAIMHFERTRGVRLINRSPRGSTLTEAGTTLVGAGRDLLESMRIVQSAIDQLTAAHQAQLRVGASMTIAEFLTPLWLAQLRAQHPESVVALTVSNSAHVIEMLEAGKCDVGFVETPTVPRRLGQTIVARDRLVVVVSPAHAWARRTFIDADELARTPLIAREQGSGTRTTLDDSLSNLTPANPLIVLNSTAAVRVSVLSGAGPAVLSELSVRSWIASGELVEVPVKHIRLERVLRAVWVGPNPLEGVAADLVGIAREATG
ncbi:LysR family transcriptional regulator (plasmid) [Coraliomargarita sp. W4R53]